MLLTYACIAVQLLLLWSCGSAQEPGFLSIACGLIETSYTDTNNSIEWTSDAAFMTEGQTLALERSSLPRFVHNMRLFTGNQSKYCYRLSNSAVKPGVFFLVRASFTAPASYNPKSTDGNFRFKILINADEWQDVEIPDSIDNWTFREIYTRAIHNSIDVCLARSALEGDPPFISALELRPLPPSLSATRLMATRNVNFVVINRIDYGSDRLSRYPSDPLDRFWLGDNVTAPYLQTSAPIYISDDDQDKPPVDVLQTAYGGVQGNYSSIYQNYDNQDVNGKYYWQIYWAEIDKRVNASGQRVFKVRLNEETVENLEPIDVFSKVGGNTIDVFLKVGGNTSYEVMVGPVRATEQGIISCGLIADSYLFPPFLSATELFQARPVSNASFPNDVTAIDDLKTNMNLSTYTGDPCLPIGFGYSWITCTNTTSTEVSRIISISLSNHYTGGKIPESINALTQLDKILLDGNNLEGSIPDMSALTNLQTLNLSNNKLNGFIPESLATLKNLRVLNLANNNLEGEVPAPLIQRQKEMTLDIDFSGNPLCGSSSNVACKSSKSKNKIGLIIGVVIAVLFVVLAVVALTLFKIYKKNKPSSLVEQSVSTIEEEESSLYRRSKANQVIQGPVPMLSIQEFTFQEIKLATNNFTSQIGRGGFGPVYKGSLKNGRIVAIKVSSNSPHQGSKEFLNEVDILSRIHHKNLVGLIGFCKEENLILVYEFMSGGSLFDRLHGKFARNSPLSWSTRLQILVEAAQGFDYLHYGCNPRIIHRDIKSGNILLNDKLEAKISDFGISRNSFINESGAPPTALMGSTGYFDPEYLSTLTLTEKVDVYSFGVLIFEIVCGRTPIFVDTSNKQTHILEWIRSYIDRGIIDDIVDVALHDIYNLSSVWKVIDVALECVKFSSNQRPNMNIVYTQLKEAQSMELEGDRSDIFREPTTTFRVKDYESFSLTQVNPR